MCKYGTTKKSDNKNLRQIMGQILPVVLDWSFKV